MYRGNKMFAVRFVSKFTKFWRVFFQGKEYMNLHFYTDRESKIPISISVFIDFPHSFLSNR